MDGVVRDDWISQTSNKIEIENSAHEVFVGFAQGEMSEKEYNIISTMADSHILSLTPSTVGKKGDDYSVSWEVEEGYKVSEILLDGFSYPVSDIGTINFENVAGDHTVEIRTIQDEYVFVSTDVTGAGTITASASIKQGEDYTVNWKANNKDSTLTKVIINGTVVYDGYSSEPFYAYTFEDVQENQWIQVEFKTNGNLDTTDKSLVSTQIINGPGTITPNQLVKSGSNVTIEWKTEEGYEVEKVFYSVGNKREELAAQDDSVVLKNVTQDCKVQVVLKTNKTEADEEDKYSVVTKVTGGEGFISPSVVDISEGENHTVTWSPKEGYWVEYITVDGVIRDDLLSALEYCFEDIKQDHVVELVLASDEKEPNKDDDGEDYGGNGEEDKEPNDSEFYRIITSAKGNGTVSRTVSVGVGTDHTVTWHPKDGETVVSVIIDGIQRPDLLQESGVQFIDIMQNHTVEVVFSQSTGEHPDASEEVFWVRTELYGGKGTITSTMVVHKGDNYLVEWAIEEGYYVKSLVVDGTVMDNELSVFSWMFENIESDRSIVVILDKEKQDSEEPENPQPELKEILITVSTEMVGEGIFTDTVILSQGENHEVSWSAEEGWEIYKVFIDGVEQSEEIASSGILAFVELMHDHHVKVILRRDGEDKPNPEDSKYKVETAIYGGEGTITPTMYYTEGADAAVLWSIDKKYEISKIVVDGEEREDIKELGIVGFLGIQENHKVEVILIPLKPEQIEIQKQAINKTDLGGPTQVNDMITYKISVENKKEYSLWQDVIIKDVMPEGMEFVKGSLYLIRPGGTEEKLKDEYYNASNRIVEVPVGDVWGGESYALSFDVKVTSNAIGKDIANVGEALGTDPEGKEVSVKTSPVYPHEDDKPEKEGVIWGNPEPYIEKYAENKTHAGNQTMVGDLITYIIKVGNRQEGSAWENVMIEDKLPKGLRLNKNSMYIINPEGKKDAIKTSAYDDESRVIRVVVGDIYGGEQYQVVFDVTIEAEALGEDIGNIAFATGGKPDVDNKADEDSPNGGNQDIEHPGEDICIEIDKPVYPWDEKGTVLPGIAETEVEKTVTNENCSDGTKVEADENISSSVAAKYPERIPDANDTKSGFVYLYEILMLISVMGVYLNRKLLGKRDV